MSDFNQFVTQVYPNDVLFGRGSGPNDHEGNIKFREIVAERKAEYMSTNHRQTKANIAKEIVQTVLKANGRFLKKLEGGDLQKFGFPSSTEVYQIVGDDTVMEKAKQALRQNREKRDADTKKAPHALQQKKENPMKSDVITIFSGGLGVHESLEQLPIPSIVNPIQAAVEREIAQEGNREYETYTAQLETLVNQQERSKVGSQVNSRKVGRRGSLKVEDVFKKKDGAMQSMVESFQGMSTGEFSTDTIGTIDNFGNSYNLGTSNMSNMSISSLFKGNGSKDSLTNYRTSSGDKGSEVWELSERQTGGVVNETWTSNEESRRQQQQILDRMNKQVSMPPPQKRASMNQEQLASVLMSEPLESSSATLQMSNMNMQESNSAFQMSTLLESNSAFQMSTSGFSMGGSLMMTSMDSLPETEGSPTRILPP